MKNKKINIVLYLSSFIYTIQFYINNKITPVGDQTAFLEYAKEFHYNYLFFGIDRYFTWSSRLLIESATLLFSVHEKLFYSSSLSGNFAFGLCFKKADPFLALAASFTYFYIPSSDGIFKRGLYSDLCQLHFPCSGYGTHVVGTIAGYGVAADNISV